MHFTSGVSLRCWAQYYEKSKNQNNTYQIFLGSKSDLQLSNRINIVAEITSHTNSLQRSAGNSAALIKKQLMTQHVYGQKTVRA